MPRGKDYGSTLLLMAPKVGPAAEEATLPEADMGRGKEEMFVLLVRKRFLASDVAF